MTSQVEIGNPANDPLASDILSELARLAGGSGTAAEQQRIYAPYHKGEIVTAIVLGISSSAAYDLLKAIVLRFATRKDFTPTVSITINNTSVELGQILSREDGRQQ